jgi:hypothetical protein
VSAPPIIGSGIIAVKFALPRNDSDDNLRLRVLALYPGGLVWFTGTRAPDARGAFTWARPATRVEQAIRAPQPGQETTTDFRDGNPLAFLPAAPAPDASPRAAADGLVSDVAVHNPDRGDLGSCYVMTVGGDFGATQRDTLWFFDGKDKWYPTGLRLPRPGGTWKAGHIPVTAPALGVVVDPSGDRCRARTARRSSTRSPHAPPGHARPRAAPGRASRRHQAAMPTPRRSRRPATTGTRRPSFDSDPIQRAT